ncbi:mechanosensitive ion channel domain-containing protein [Ahrensia kielensis]|uniref:Small-conductance mechanosensitive channel n=1 Tax=Ahrensia kielensis TaxID=76980 RepID=A0ABU9T8D0_9HYPH
MRLISKTIFTFIFWLSLSLVASAQSDTAAQSSANKAIINADTSVIDDVDIDLRIERILAELDGMNRVYVIVSSGVVTLRGEVTEASLAEQAIDVAQRVEGVVTVRNEITEVTSLRERLVPVWERLNNRFWQSIAFVPLFTVAVVVGGIVFLIGLFVASRTWPWDRLSPNQFIADLLRQIIRLIFFVSGVVLALDILGATALLGTILGAAGIVGLAIGFAVRDTVENYIASILLSIRQPFRPRDFISIEGYEGFVISLTSRATILMDASGNHIRIPNSTVFKSNITNFSRNPHRRFSFEIGVASESNLDKALETGLNAARAQDFVLQEPAPDAWISSIGDSNVVLVFTGWVDQTQTSYTKAQSETMRLTKLALERNGFALPEPIFRIIHQGDALSEAPKKAAAPKLETSANEREDDHAKDVRPDESIIERVDEERSNAEREDLLSENIRDELGKKEG